MDTAFFESILSSKINRTIVYNANPVVKFHEGGTSYVNKHQTVLEYSFIKILKSKSPVRDFFASLPLISSKLIAIKIMQNMHFRSLIAFPRYLRKLIN